MAAGHVPQWTLAASFALGQPPQHCRRQVVHRPSSDPGCDPPLPPAPHTPSHLHPGALARGKSPGEGDPKCGPPAGWSLWVSGPGWAWTPQRAHSRSDAGSGGSLEWPPAGQALSNSQNLEPARQRRVSCCPQAPGRRRHCHPPRRPHSDSGTWAQDGALALVLGVCPAAGLPSAPGRAPAEQNVFPPRCCWGPHDQVSAAE